MPWPHRSNGVDVPRRAADHAVLPRLPPRSRSPPAAAGSDHEHGVEAERRPRVRPCAACAIRHPCWANDLLLRVSPMTAPNGTLRFDLERARSAARAGSKRFWSSLDELIDAEGFREWLVAEFPTAASLFDEPERRQVLKLMGAS